MVEVEELLHGIVPALVSGQVMPAEDLLGLRKRREEAVGDSEDTFRLLVVLPEGKRFRVYANQPGRKGRMLGSPIIVPRNAFPNVLFE